MSPLEIRIACAFLGLTACVSIGLFVWLKDPRNPVNKYFALFNLSIAFWNSSDVFMYFFQDYARVSLWADRLTYIGGVLFVAFNVLFYCALAGDAEPPRRVRSTIRLATPVLSVLVLSPLVVRSISFQNGALLEVPGPAFAIFAAYIFWGILYGTVRMIKLLRSCSEQRRIQVQYMLVAFGVAFTGLIIYALWVMVSASGGPPFFYFLEIGYNLIMAYAIVQHGALEVKTVVHKTAMWLATSSIVVVPLAIFLALLGPWITGNPRSGGVVLAVVMLALLVYARTVQPLIDHYFQRRKYDMQSVLQRFVQEMSVTKRFNDLIEQLIRTIQNTLYVEKAVFIRLAEAGLTEDQERFLSGARDRILKREELQFQTQLQGFPQAQVFIPIVNEDRVIGVVGLGPKRNLEKYKSLDFEFLGMLKAEITIAVSNSLLYDSLEEKVQDRTQELEESNRKLKELDEVKTKFFATVSHELRTPLTLILAPLESLLKGEMGPLSDGVQRHVSVMHQNGLRLLKQINNLLDLTKLDAGRMALQFRRGELDGFFRGLVASVGPMAQKKGIRLIGRSEASLPARSYFDRDRLEKVVLNLLFNAVKFTGAGGHVTLTWGQSAEGDLRVQVADTGIGIAKQDLPKLFKRFSQVDAATNRRYEGTGIGLALAKEIVELHGGRIGVESKLGRGSTFTFSIPLLQNAPQDETTGDGSEQIESDGVPPADWTQDLRMEAEHSGVGIDWEPIVAAEPSLSPANGRQILIVEDNADMREFIAFELQGDYRVLKAANGIEGLRTASEALPDAIVSDVMMPEMDGYQLCREIRRDPRTRHIPVILLTARADMAMKIEGLEHGADDYLTKPFNAQELRAKIKSLLEQRRLEREIQQRNEALEAALTELKNTQTQLVQSEKMAGLGLLVAGMAHEINNPINFAKNSLEVVQRAWRHLKPLLARDRMSPDAVEAVEDVDASLGIVKNGVARTEQIVGQLKSFVRKDENQRVACSVQEGLASTLELTRPMMGRQIVLHADLQSSGRVFAVPGKLNQVWMNLLQNAVQAVGASGEIWVESRDHEHMVTVTVRDSGPGIAKEHLSRLFEPFFTTKPVGQGTGLGLSVSYQIVQDVGGRIDVKSEPGHGAEFTVVLPLADVLSQAA